MARFALILPAAGRSTRFNNGKTKKVFTNLEGRAVWLRSAEPFVNRDDVHQIIVAINPDDRELFERRFRPNVAFLNIQVVEGGEERADTVAKALAAVDPTCDYVAIHDAARPCIASESIDAVFSAAVEHGAALLAIPVADTLKRADAAGTFAVETVPRAGLYQAQTPQVFRRDWLVEAYANRSSLAENATDDARLVEALGRPCRLVPGSPLNIKITTQVDLKLAAAILDLLPKSKPDPPAGPFADERAGW